MISLASFGTVAPKNLALLPPEISVVPRNIVWVRNDATDVDVVLAPMFAKSRTLSPVVTVTEISRAAVMYVWIAELMPNAVDEDFATPVHISALPPA